MGTIQKCHAFLLFFFFWEIFLFDLFIRGHVSCAIIVYRRCDPTDRPSQAQMTRSESRYNPYLADRPTRADPDRPSDRPSGRADRPTRFGAARGRRQ